MRKHHSQLITSHFKTFTDLPYYNSAINSRKRVWFLSFGLVQSSRRKSQEKTTYATIVERNEKKWGKKCKQSEERQKQKLKHQNGKYDEKQNSNTILSTVRVHFKCDRLISMVFRIFQYSITWNRLFAIWTYRTAEYWALWMNLQSNFFTS